MGSAIVALENRRKQQTVVIRAHCHSLAVLQHDKQEESAEQAVTASDVTTPRQTLQPTEDTCPTAASLPAETPLVAGQFRKKNNL